MFDFCDRTFGDKINVKQFGAIGDGVNDDTAAFQAAINALPATGGTVFVPAGHYACNMVRLRSRMKLRMAPDAYLERNGVLIPKYYVLYAYHVEDVTIEGGNIDGKRLGEYPSGSTYEWNHGIQIRLCSRITIRDICIYDCGGDGVCVGGDQGKLSDDILLLRVQANNNRRNNITVGGVNDCKIVECTSTKANGTSPECGIDIEPDPPGINTNTLIESCTISDNNKWGINVFTNAGNVTIRNNTIRRNVRGIDIGDAKDVVLEGNEVSDHSAEGVVIHNGATNVTVDDNIFYNNYMRVTHAARAPFTQAGTSNKTGRDILIQKPTTNVDVLTNQYR